MIFRYVGLDDIGPYRVSTVRLPYPLLGGVYQTLVFRGNDNIGLACARYHTKNEALAGHKVMVEKWRLIAEAEKDKEATDNATT